MTFILSDRVGELTSTQGQGTLDLDGAIAGFRGFVAAIGSGNTCFYGITDGASFEVGIGTVTAGSPNTLSRDTVIGNSAGTQSKINFGSGSKTVFTEVPSAHRCYRDDSGLGAGFPPLPGILPATELTIAAGSITPTQGDHKVDTESDAASDTLATADASNFSVGQHLRLSAENAARVVTVEDSSGETVEFQTSDGQDYALDDAAKWIEFEWDGTDFVEVERYNGPPASQAQVQAGSLIFGTDTGSADTYAITPVPQPAALVAGMKAGFKVVNANTGASTFALGTLTAKAIKKNAGADDLEAGDLPAGAVVEMIYDGTAWQVTSSLRRTFKSGQITLSASSANSTAHGLGRIPSLGVPKLICTDAGGDQGYSQNDVIWLDPNLNNDASADHGWTLRGTATDIHYRFGSSVGVVVVKGDAATFVQLDPTKWDLILEAWIN